MNHVMEQFFGFFSKGVDVIRDRNTNPLPCLPANQSLDPYTAFLHEEMRQCYLQGLDHAAIVMACSLLEYTIKSAIYQEEHFKAGRQFSQEKWDEVEKQDLGKLINRGRTLGIMTKDECKRLHSFRESVRNYYMHGTTPEPVKNAVFPMHVADWRTSEIEKQDIELRTDISLQRVARLLFDRQQCDHVIAFVDLVVREILSRKENKILQAEAENPLPKPTAEQVRCIMDKLNRQGINSAMAIARSIPEEIKNAAERPPP